MPTFNSLPGVVVNIQDGGLTNTFAPKNDAILVIGTAGKGVCNSPYQVFDRWAASSEFGFSGSLERAIEECTTYSDNVIAFRMGTSPLVLKGVGKDTTEGATSAGFDITFKEVTSDAADRYKVWYKAGVLAVWLDDELQYSNQANAAVDRNNVTLSAAASTGKGLQYGTGASPSLATAITVTAAADLTGTAAQPAPTLTDPVDGTKLTGRQKYVAFRKALDLLAGMECRIVFAPDAQLDAPNVAFYVAADSTTAVNNPATNADALDWLKATPDSYGDSVYQWASEVTDSAGGTVTAMDAADATERVAAGFMEVNWASTLGNFCASLTQTGPMVVAVIGTSGPNSATLTDTRKWVGFLPVYDQDGKPTKAGSGLLGCPYLTGTTATKLNPLCLDYANGYRKAGLFVTLDGSYDGEVQVDLNGNQVDAGAHLHVAADWAFMSNGWGSNYVGNIAGLVAGYLSALDPSSGLTNKAIKATQIWKATPAQMDALTQAKISVLRFKGANVQPVMLHDLSAASDASDYTNFVRVRCMGMVIKVLRDRALNYIGESSLDGLTLVAMKTQLDQDLVNLTKRGYCNHSTVNIYSTPAQQKIGHATLSLIVHPADELIQLTANVGVTR